MKQEKYLNNDKLNAELLENGYVILKAFNKRELSAIKNLFNELSPKDKGDRGIYSLPSNDSTQEVDSRIQEFFQKIYKDKFEDLFYNHNYLYSFFILKKKKGRPLHWHSDPSLYDESIFSRPLAIWTTINNTSLNNGNLTVVPKSHKLALKHTAFPIGINKSQEVLFDLTHLIDKKAIPIILKPGEVLIHDQALLHSSTARKSIFNDRLAVKMVVTPKDVDSFILSLNNKDAKTISNYALSKKEVRANLYKSIVNNYVNRDRLEPISSLTINPYDITCNKNEIEKILEAPLASLKANPKFEQYLITNSNKLNALESDKINDLYDKEYAEAYEERFIHDKLYKDTPKFEIEVFQHLLKPKDNWLDVGCGTGYFLSQFPEVIRTGLDYSTAMINKAKKNNPEIKDFTQGDFREPKPQWNNKWDMISCMWGAYCYVESMTEINTFIKNISDWTKPDGMCFLPIIDLEDVLFLRKDLKHYNPDIQIFGGPCYINAVTWSYHDTKHDKFHENLISPHIEYLKKEFLKYFKEIHVIYYPPFPEPIPGQRKALLAISKSEDVSPKKRQSINQILEISNRNKANVNTVEDIEAMREVQTNPDSNHETNHIGWSRKVWHRIPEKIKHPIRKILGF